MASEILPEEERRDRRHGLNGGAVIVDETRQCQLRRAESAAERFVAFDDENGKITLGERNGGGQSVRAGADHHRVIRRP